MTPERTRALHFLPPFPGRLMVRVGMSDSGWPFLPISSPKPPAPLWQAKPPAQSNRPQPAQDQRWLRARQKLGRS
jgi:hypothetical protein